MKKLLAVAAFALFSQGVSAQETVTVYSSRTEELLRPLLAAYEAETGVRVRVVNNREAVLLDMLKAEGRRTEADVLMTVDAGNLWLAQQAGVLQPIKAPGLRARIPAHLRDPGNQWFGLSIRARTVVQHRDRVADGAVPRYESLADPRWKGRLCLRSSKKVYNQSLVAMMMADIGAAATERVVRGWVANLATPPLSDDTRVIQAIEAGQCDVGLVNTYYYARYAENNPQTRVVIRWPDATGPGVHVNISGAGVTRHARNPQGGQRLIEWLASDAGQRLYADVNLEYPVVRGLPAAASVAAWGPFRANEHPLRDAGRLQRAATQLMDRAGYR